MKPIVLVSPCPKDVSGINRATVSQPLGLASIAAALRDKGFMCHIIDANILNLDNDRVLRHVRKLGPAIVGISINVVTARAGLNLARQIKENHKEILVVLGGPQANICIEENLRFSKADAVVTGEGELTMLEIAQRHYSQPKDNLFQGLNGVVYTTAGGIVVNPPRERILNLDSLPYPAYDLLPGMGLYLTRARRKPAVSVITSRGCPYQCIYCNKNIFGSRMTALSAGRVVGLFEMLVKKYGVRQIDIYDDNFTLDRKRAAEIFDLIAERKWGLLINMQTGVRADSMDAELVGKMKKAGVFKIGFGVESGSPEILKTAKKELDLSRVLEAKRLAQKSGIMTYGFFILGLPGENAQTLQQTIDFAKRMDPVVANFCIAMPFAGTELYEMVKAKGKFLIDTESQASGGFYGSRAFFEYNGLNENTLLKYYRKAYFSFYFRPKKIAQTLLSIYSWHELKWVLEAGLRLMLLSIFQRRGKINESKPGHPDL